MPKRVREEKEATTSKAKKAEKTTTGSTTNDDIITTFEQLMYYESKDGNKWAGVAYAKVVGAIRALKTDITCGKDVAHLAGFGKASVTKIDELISTGKLKKLEDLKELHGPMPSNLKSGGLSSKKPAAAPAKKGGKKGAKDEAASGEADIPTKKQLKDIATAAETYTKLKNDALKALLKANRQTTTGSKPELVERCAQQKVMGAIPPCPLCAAGKLRYDAKKGSYKCPGFMDDDSFSPCYFTGDHVDRTKWQE